MSGRIAWVPSLSVMMVGPNGTDSRVSVSSESDVRSARLIVWPSTITGKTETVQEKSRLRALRWERIVGLNFNSQREFIYYMNVHILYIT
jgi:hypothetical protein